MILVIFHFLLAQHSHLLFLCLPNHVIYFHFGALIVSGVLHDTLEPCIFIKCFLFEVTVLNLGKSDVDYNVVGKPNP